MSTKANRQMTEDEVAIFLMIKDAQQNAVDVLFDELSKQAGGWVLKAVEKNFKLYDVNVDKKIMIMILTMGGGVVGKCVKYVNNIIHWCKEHSKNEIDFKLFYEEIYPFGFPDF